MTRRLLDFNGLARKFGLPKYYLPRHHKRLSRDHGFPEPLRCFGPRRLRWDEAAIDRWLDEIQGGNVVTQNFQKLYEFKKGHFTP